MFRQNLNAVSPSTLTLSEVGGRVGGPGHTHHRRLCAPCIGRRHLELRPAGSVPAEVVAAAIRRHPTHSVWDAVAEFGISYRHALAIRAGWRGDGRRAEPIPYRSRGWSNGRRNGWSVRIAAVTESEMRLMDGNR